MELLKRPFFARETVEVARDLLGKLIVRKYNNTLLTGMIVETEAYHSDDPACHAHRGKTKRNQALFGPVGHAYVYFIYGKHFCLNFVARHESANAGGVLIRALEPFNGIEIMQRLRNQNEINNLTNGPGKLGQAFAINKQLLGCDVTKKDQLWVAEHATIKASQIVESPRIGIRKATDKLWRFHLRDNNFVSR